MMRSVAQVTSLPVLPSLAEVEQLLSESLYRDWVLRIEYADPDITGHIRWRQWREPRFAITEPGPVIDAILSCRATYPGHAIRLAAEKFNPQVRLNYWIYRPGHDRAPGVHDQPVIRQAILPAASEIGRQLRNRLFATRKTVWRITALAGMMLASFLVIQEVTVS